MGNPALGNRTVTGAKPPTGASGGYNGEGDYDQGQIDASKATVYGRGTTTGSWLGTMGNGPRANELYGTASSLRGDQSVAERIQDQRTNFFYGGTATGSQDAINAARTNVDPYTQGLAGYGGQYNAAMQGADGRMAAGSDAYYTGDRFGQQGVYSTADQMRDLAQQGPGPSIAQANLQANTQQAMRQQLALAGSGRGQGGDASAYRNAAMQQAQIQGSANAQAGVRRSKPRGSSTKRTCSAPPAASTRRGARATCPASPPRRRSRA
jgi:hypothetical protein